MLSCNVIGNMGRLGNQMFQYAALKGIARYHNYDFCIPPLEKFGETDDPVKNSDANLYSFPNIQNNIKKISNFYDVNEKSFRFDEELFLNCRDNTNITGYFQTEKYFKHIEKEIRNDFEFDSKTSKIVKYYISTIYGNEELLSLHIRRGDYVKDSNFIVLGSEYYQKALEQFNSNLKVIVVSDDPEWCENQSIFKSERFKILKSNNTMIDLCFMSKCQYHIIGNSSYSWWGAWLANSKKVVAPKKWFSGSLSNWDKSDLYCPEWATI